MEAKSLGNLLKTQGVINENDWSTLEKACESKPLEIIKGITALGLISESELTNILAKESGAKIIDGPLFSHFERDVLEYVDPILMQRLEPPTRWINPYFTNLNSLPAEKLSPRSAPQVKFKSVSKN